MKDTAIVDLEVFNQALLALQNLSGEVSHVKVHPIIQTFAQSIIPPPNEYTKGAALKEDASNSRGAQSKKPASR